MNKITAEQKMQGLVAGLLESYEKDPINAATLIPAAGSTGMWSLRSWSSCAM